MSPENKAPAKRSMLYDPGYPVNENLLRLTPLCAAFSPQGDPGHVPCNDGAVMACRDAGTSPGKEA